MRIFTHENPSFLPSGKHFNVSTKSEIHKFGIALLQQHFSEISTNNEPVQSTSNSQVTQLQQNSLRDRLKLSLMQFTSNEPSTRNINENLKREFSWYERNKVKTPLLNQLYNALLSIQPTSTQSERNFSISNNVLTKQRKRLLNKNLNAIVFVKSHFQNPE